MISVLPGVKLRVLGTDMRSFRPGVVETGVDAKALTLRPEERLISVQVLKRRPVGLMAPADALARLAGVEQPEQIGQRGPVMAACPLAWQETAPEKRLYEALFARDALITADFVLDLYPRLMQTTLLRLAELQGLSFDDCREEEPGRIIQEQREPDDPVGQELTRRRGWQWPYYGSVDATPLFIKGAAAYCRKFGTEILMNTYVDRRGKKVTLKEAVRRAMEWMMYKMGQNPEGLVESRGVAKNCNLNQAWKDSHDAYHQADGSLVNFESGIASIEVQALAYDALLDAAEVLLPEEGKDLRRRAGKIWAAVMGRLWIEDERGGYFALGSDRDEEGHLRPLKVRSSNMGHALNSRLLDGTEPDVREKKEALVKTLFAPDMLNAGGIRTLSALENRYRPESYHNGTVWPWDTYYISLGLERQGYAAEAKNLRRRVMDCVQATGMYPEFVSGRDTQTPEVTDRLVRVFDARYQFEHFIEQPPQEVQAWTAGAVVAMEAKNK